MAWEQGQVLTRVAGGTATAIVRIPRFGDDYAVPLLDGTDDEALASGFGHFADSAAPEARATSPSPATGSPTGSRFGGCPSCSRATR